MDIFEDLVSETKIALTGMIIIAVIAIFVIIYYSNNVSELGEAICEERFDMDFDSYGNKELKCKEEEIKEEILYDGIVVQVI